MDPAHALAAPTPVAADSAPLPLAQADAPTVFMQTYGCQMNILDSQLVQEQLVTLGYKFVPNQDEADIVLMNTCSVRALAEQKVWSLLGRLEPKKAARPTMMIGVLGCMAEREASAIAKRMPHVDILCGPSNLAQLPMLLDNARQQRRLQTAISGHVSRRTATRDLAQEQGLEALDTGRSMAISELPVSQAYVRITRGCNKFCAFCVVPYTRGPEVHRPPEHVVDEVRRLVQRGVREVTLLGQTINHYHYHDGGKTTSFADLLGMVHDQVPELGRLRFLTSYPRDFTDAALDVMAQGARMCRYLHIPAQTGSDRLLRKMNRGYTLAEYEGLIERARARMPDIRLAGDMIVGYPSETDEDHQLSMALMRRTRLKACYVFKYSPRSGTVASKRHTDDVPDALKKERNAELLALQAEISLNEHKARIGHTLEVLVEKQGDARPVPQASGDIVTLGGRRTTPGQVRLIGRTRGDEIVAFDGDRAHIGNFVQVRIAQATPMTLYGAMQP